VKKTPQQAALEYAQTSIESKRGEDPVTTAMIAETVDEVLRLPKAFVDAALVDRDLLIEELESRYSVWIGATVALEQNDDHAAWLTPERKRGWRLWPRYREYLEKRWSTIAVEALDDATDEVVSRIEDPKRAGAWDRRGLVVGHVQSGKTSNYTGVICKAADAGYKVIIVLAGLHNNLRSQTQMRLDEGFLGYETMPRERGRETPINSLGVGEVDGDPAIRPDYVTTRDQKGDFSMAVGRNLGVSPGGRPMLFVVKKNTKVLKNLIRWIDGILNGRPALKDVPLLVIDDEADHASVDTNAQAFDENGKPDDDHDPTRINEHIRTLLRKFEKSAYVGYTATPFANVFIHEQGRTAKLGPDLFPRSFIVNLPAPSNYDGPVRLFGLEQTEDVDGVPALPLFRAVDDHADTLDPREAHGWVPPAHKSLWHPRYHGEDVVPPSLRKAILSFMLTCAARRARAQTAVHNSMLVHVTRYTAVQKLVRDQVENEVKNIRNRLRIGGGAGVIEEFRRLWDTDYLPTMKLIRKTLPDRALKPIGWSDVSPHLPDVVNAIHVRTINGTAGDILDYETHSDTGFAVIAIGGDKLARGLTLEGLSVSYFLRASKMYDTLMQMGRWFGFRPGYLDLCRLYTTAELNDWFGHITQAAEELRREFDHMHAINGTPKDYGLRVRSHPTMMVTSKVKMRNATEVLIDFAGAIQETINFGRAPQETKSNLLAAVSFIQALGRPTEINPSRPRSGDRAHKWDGARLWSNVSGRRVVEFLGDYKTHETAISVNSLMMANFVKGQMERGQLTDWTVALLAGDGSNASVGGAKINLVKRKANERSKSIEEQKAEGIHLIRRLLAPRDEAIDFDAAEYDEALRITRDEWVRDPGRSKRKTPPNEPSGLAIRTVRGQRPQHGLLLLYPLDPAGMDFESADPIIGFGVSFPASKNSKPVNYVVNNVYYEQEYGAEAW
jgi:hypothetical protein